MRHRSRSSAPLRAERLRAIGAVEPTGTAGGWLPQHVLFAASAVLHRSMCYLVIAML